MCSVFAILEMHGDVAELRARALEQSKKMRHRGPDWSGIHTDDAAILAHERLAIVDVDNGAQPLKNAAGTHVLAVNGEIYNHRELRAKYGEHEYLTNSDCEVILPLYAKHGANFLNELNGIFAFVLHDAETGRYLVARDPIGVMPLYTGRDEAGNLYVASELKALVDVCKTIEDFPPGHYLDSVVGHPVRYYEPSWREYDAVEGVEYDPKRLHDALDAAVKRQLMADVPWAVLLSGGLDSSLVSALAAAHAKKRIEASDAEEAWWPRLHSFAIGLEGSPDLAAAEKVAAALGTVHHSITYTIQEGLDAVTDVIYALETFDVTTIRAATPMYLMARRIKAMGIKMVLSGEGSDEIFGGYLYFHKAPGAREFHEETVRKLDELYKYDCLRANKTLAAWGIEARVPFLDREFLDVAMSFDTKHKMCVDADGEPRMEKWSLRNAFQGVIPDEILWRQKEQFSDGVGYSWIDTLKEVAAEKVSDEQLARAHFRFPSHTPLTKEAYMYREIHEKHFPHEDAVRVIPDQKSIACSTETALKWEKSFADMADPSGRAIRGVHNDSY